MSVSQDTESQTSPKRGVVFLMLGLLGWTAFILSVVSVGNSNS